MPYQRSLAMSIRIISINNDNISTKLCMEDISLRGTFLHYRILSTTCRMLQRGGSTVTVEMTLIS